MTPKKALLLCFFTKMPIAIFVFRWYNGCHRYTTKKVQTMKKFRADHARWVRYLCVIFALVCLFFALSSHLHHCHGTDCPVCALQDLMGAVLPAAAFTGLLKLLFALASADCGVEVTGQKQTLVQLNVKLSD